jgi:hypothetical protein
MNDEEQNDSCCALFCAVMIMKMINVVVNTRMIDTLLINH